MLQIETGRFYRMRCGGAVKISKIEITGTVIASDENYDWEWDADGTYLVFNKPSMLDIVAEISESEYNVIINGELSSNPLQLEAVKAENARLTEAYEGATQSAKDWQESHFKLMKDTENERRFEAAKTIYPALLSHPHVFANWGGNNGMPVPELVVRETVSHIDALLKALEESK